MHNAFNNLKVCTNNLIFKVFLINDVSINLLIKPFMSRVVKFACVKCRFRVIVYPCRINTYAYANIHTSTRTTTISIKITLLPYLQLINCSGVKKIINEEI